MKLRWITAAALTLGASAMFAAPAMADSRFDNHRDDRQEHRHDHRYDNRREVRHVETRRDVRHVDIGHDHSNRHAHSHRSHDFDRSVDLCDVPRRVLETAKCESRGQAIEAVQFVSRDGKLFYRFRIHARSGDHLNLRISADGRLLSVQEVG